MSQRVTVFHPDRGLSMCSAPATSPAQPGLTSPENGTLVTCGLCGRHGVIPDEGHELEFLPPGTERDENGRFLLRLT